MPPIPEANLLRDRIYHLVRLRQHLFRLGYAISDEILDSADSRLAFKNLTEVNVADIHGPGNIGHGNVTSVVGLDVFHGFEQQRASSLSPVDGLVSDIKKQAQEILKLFLDGGILHQSGVEVLGEYIVIKSVFCLGNF